MAPKNPKGPLKGVAQEAGFDLESFMDAFAVEQEGPEKGTYTLNHPRLLISHIDFLSEKFLDNGLTNALIDRINEAVSGANIDNDAYCRVKFIQKSVDFFLYDKSEKEIYSVRLPFANVYEVNSLRIRLLEGMEDKRQTDQTQLRPRWAEEARPKKQVKLRLEPNLITDVDAAASAEGMTRNDWIEQSIRKSLKPDS